ncbi:MAG: trimeric intracellular cation channel family protein [Spirochaetaceae bacterium]|nr:trimeric intracellular cation channel family protein [Spirochaetaceae bacterium]
MENSVLTRLIEYAGTFAFAISGIRLASIKQFDLFGAFIVGFTAAVGGGTARDVFLGQSPFWLFQPSYLVCTIAALIFVILFKRYILLFEHTILVFDTIGLGFFTLVGIEKTLTLGHSLWVCVVMGMITGAVGGIARDVITNEVPIVFQKEIYALACVFGGIFFCVLYKTGAPRTVLQLGTSAAVILVRVIAIRFRIGLPILR